MADPTFRAVSAAVLIPSQGNGSVSVTKPTGTVDGDYVLLVCLTGNAAGAADVAPAGFTSLQVVNNGTFNSGLRVFGKVAASEGASWSLTEGVSNSQGTAFAISYSNPGGTPINASAQSGQQNATTAPAFSTVTTTQTGKLIGIALEYNNRAATITAAGSMTSRAASSGNGRSYGFFDEDIATTGSIAGRTATSSVSGDFYAISILLAGPASAPILITPTGTATGPTQATIGVTSDTAPTITAISYQILPAATADPSAPTIVGAPTGTISTGSAGALTAAIAALTTNTAVKVHFAQGTTSNVQSSAAFTPNTLAISGTALSAQTGTAGAAFTWTGATPESLITNTGNGSGSWTATAGVGASGVTVNSSTGILVAGSLGTAGSYTITLQRADGSTVPGAQTVTKTVGLTISASSDGTPPTLTGVVTPSAITASSATLTWPAGADNVAVTGYEYSLNGGAYFSVGNVLTYGLSGLTESTLYTCDVRARDAAGNVSAPVISGSFTTTAASGGSNIAGPFFNNTLNAAHAAGTALYYSWLPAWRIGAALPGSPVHGTGVVDSTGSFAPPGITGAGVLMVAIYRGGATTDDVYYQAFA